eukprot:s1902_g6.t1
MCWSRSLDRCLGFQQDYYPPGECSRRCFIGLNCVQGECDADGYCQCKPNWYGETCSVSCPRCSLEGSWGCNEGREGDGTCSCKTGWDGPVCSDPAETCGGFPGVRTRIVRCYNSRSKAILPDERCLGEKPLEQEACTTPLCSCSVPPPILHSDYDKTVGVCSFLQNDRTCRAICDDGYARSGEYKCVASRYVQQPICLPLGDAAHVKEALFSYVTLAGIDLVAVANLTWWYGSISPSLQQVLAAALVPIPGYQVTLRAWREVDWPAQAPRRLAEMDSGGNGSASISRFLQGNMAWATERPRFGLPGETTADSAACQVVGMSALDRGTTTLVIRSNAKINYDGILFMLDKFCGGTRAFDFVYLPWPKLAIINFVSQEQCVVAHCILSRMVSSESSGLRYVKPAVFQGLGPNLALFCAKSGYDAIQDPGAPRIFIAGTPVPLMLAVNLYVTAELLQRSQAQNVSPDADGDSGRPQKDAGYERTRGCEVPSQRPSCSSSLPTLLADSPPRASLHAPPACGYEVALEVPFILETEDEYAFGLAESMIQFFADSDVATETTILKALEEKLEELCFTVLPSLRPMRCTAPEMVFIGPPVRAPAAVLEGLPGWAIGVFCILLLLVVFLCGYVWKLRQKKQRREAQVQRLKEKAAKSRSEEELVQEMWETALTDDTGKLKTGVEETLELPDGSSYIGGLQDGDPHGVGKMVWPDGRTLRAQECHMTYHGNWVFGQPHGQGVMSSIAPVEAEYETWVYSGQFQDGLRTAPHGVGRCEWAAVGAWYEGDWVLDAEHGLGELGAGATESQDGDPHVWCMYNGEKQDSNSATVGLCFGKDLTMNHCAFQKEAANEENVATSRVFPGPEDELMVVVLQAREKEAAELDDVELHLKRYGLSVGNPHVWVARHWSAFVVTWVQQDGPLDRWNWAQLKQVGAGARLVLPNSTIWGVNGVRGDIKAMTEMLLSPKERELTLEVWGPASLRFESIRDDLSKRLGWFKESNVNTEYAGLTFQRKSREAQAHEQSKPWLQRTGLQAASMSATTKSETMSLTQTAPRMTDKPGLPALLRMPEVPAPPSSLVASVVLPKAGARQDEDKPAAKAKAKAGGRKPSAVPPLRWPQAPPAPSEAMPDGTRSLEDGLSL